VNEALEGLNLVHREENTR